MPDSLVEKKGSNIRSRSSGSIPSPLSETVISTIDSPPVRLVISSLPPPGIDWAPLRKRFQKTCWSCRLSASTKSPSVISDDISTPRDPGLCLKTSRISLRACFRSTTSLLLGAGRANTRKSVMSSLSLAVSLSTISINRLLSLSSEDNPSSRTCIEPLMEARGFLISCAIPAASSPRALSFSSRFNCSSISLIRVRSWKMTILSTSISSAPDTEKPRNRSFPSDRLKLLSSLKETRSPSSEGNPSMREGNISSILLW